MKKDNSNKLNQLLNLLKEVIENKQFLFEGEDEDKNMNEDDMENAFKHLQEIRDKFRKITSKNIDESRESRPPITHTRVANIDKAIEVLNEYKGAIIDDEDEDNGRTLIGMSAIKVNARTGEKEQLGLDEMLYEILVSEDADNIHSSNIEVVDGENVDNIIMETIEKIRKRKAEIEDENEGEYFEDEDEDSITNVSIEAISSKCSDDIPIMLEKLKRTKNSVNAAVYFDEHRGTIQFVIVKTESLKLLKSIEMNCDLIVWDSPKDLAIIIKTIKAIESESFLEAQDIVDLGHAMFINIADIIVHTDEKLFYFITAFSNFCTTTSQKVFENREDTHNSPISIKIYPKHAINSDLYFDDIVKKIFSNTDILQFLPLSKSFIKKIDDMVTNMYEEGLNANRKLQDAKSGANKSVLRILNDYTLPGNFEMFIGLAKHAMRGISLYGGVNEERFQSTTLHNDLSNFLIEFNGIEGEDLSEIIDAKLVN